MLYPPFAVNLDVQFKLTLSLMQNEKLDLKHELLGDIQALAEEAAKVMGDAVQQQSEEAISTLKAQFEVAESRFEEIYGEIKRGPKNTAAELGQNLRDRPGRALAIVGGVGLLIGVLLGRASKNS
jgi:ElaB/YqjD/DUF883 family membrane-anchored ribosome-binding protein